MNLRLRSHRLFASLFAALASLACIGTADAEELRTLVASSVTLPLDSQGLQLSLAYNEAIAVTWPKDALFVQGIEIELRYPQAALAFPGAIAWEIWRRIDPLPEKTRYAYSGDRIVNHVLPARAGFVIQIPTRGDHGLRSTPFAELIPTIVEAKDFPFLFRLFPIAKGIPPELEKATFQLRLRPLFTDEGGFRLNLRYPEGIDRGDYALFVDGRPVEPKDLHVLKPGPHFLRISSDSYREETRSFSIEQGKTIELAIELADTTPILLIEAPDSALVLLDGQKLNHVQKPSMTVDAGEHTLICRIGDYSLTRKFSAFRGKTYKVLLSIDLSIQENQ
ncbi:MAG: hypothetical protein WCL50_10755 [Spirochaetota bacterium]